MATESGQEPLPHTSGATPDKGGEGVDFEALFGKTNQELQETREKTDRISKEFETKQGEWQKTSETLDRLKAALLGDTAAGETDPYASEISELEADMEEWKDAALQAERAGRPMPRTAKLAIDSAKRRIAAINKERDSQKEIAELKAQLNKVADPQYAADQKLYVSTDHLLESALQSIYGNDPSYDDVRQNQMQAIAKAIGKEFDALRNDTENPQHWQRINRDPKALQKLVQHFVHQNIPPVARKLMEQEVLRNTPTSFEDLLGAFREAKAQSQKNPNDQKAKQIVKELKGKVWSAYANGQFKGKRFNVGDLAD